MQYQEALRRWGAAKLDVWAAQKAKSISMWPSLRGGPIEPVVYAPVDPDSVTVDFQFDEGAHYGGSQDYSASADVRITGTGRDGELHVLMIPAEEFNFATVLGEIVTAADGTVTA